MSDAVAATPFRRKTTGWPNSPASRGSNTRLPYASPWISAGKDSYEPTLATSTPSCGTAAPATMMDPEYTTVLATDGVGVTVGVGVMVGVGVLVGVNVGVGVGGTGVKVGVGVGVGSGSFGNVRS